MKITKVKAIFSAFAVIVLSMVTLAVNMGPASAGYLQDGKDPDDLNCSSSIRVGSPISIYTAKTYYGWAEWRYGTSGACKDYQWIRLHVRFDIYYVKSTRFVVSEKLVGTNKVIKTDLISDSVLYYPYPNADIAKLPGDHTYGVTYNVGLIYAKYWKVRGEILATSTTGYPLFFGTSYKPVTWEA